MEEPIIKPYVIGLDLGGTNSVFGIVDSRGDIKATTAIKTQAYDEVEDYVKASADALQIIIDQVGGIDKIKSMGIGAPNANYYTGNIEFAPNLKWGHSGIVPLADMFSERLGIPVGITNDANAAAIGEMTYGAARGMKNFIEITLGTGVGSGIVINGQVVYGSDGFAGETWVMSPWYVVRTAVCVVVAARAVWRLIARQRVWLARHVRCCRRPTARHCSVTWSLIRSPRST